jgi:predicted tellurium resistance membrane protein TerC
MVWAQFSICGKVKRVTLTACCHILASFWGGKCTKLRYILISWRCVCLFECLAREKYKILNESKKGYEGRKNKRSTKDKQQCNKLKTNTIIDRVKYKWGKLD